MTNRSSRLIENENRYFDSKFSQWEIDQIISWLYTIDLDQYAAEFRKYFRNGFELLQATQTDLEKVRCFDHFEKDSSIKSFSFLLFE